MLHYLIKKVGFLLTSFFVIITATFFLMKAIPGDPFNDEKAIPKEILKNLYDHYGLNDPWYTQYGRYLHNIAVWDLGPSFKYKGRTVNEIIAEGFPVSLTLGCEAIFLSISLGVLLGTVAALKQNKWQDYFAMVLAILGISVPSFVFATFLQYIFSIKLNILPVARWGSFAQSILPAFSLSMLPIAFIARLTRSSMLEVLQSDYIKTARAKGLCETKIIVKHAMRNALLPVVTFLGQLTANVFTGSFVIEKIFGIPGLGQWMVTSITNRDYTVIMGTTVFYSIVLLLAMFCVDIAYGFIDPRIKIKKGS